MSIVIERVEEQNVRRETMKLGHSDCLGLPCPRGTQSQSNITGFIECSTRSRRRWQTTGCRDRPDVTYDGYLPCRSLESGRITVDGKRLYEVVRQLPGEEVDFSVNTEENYSYL